MVKIQRIYYEDDCYIEVFSETTFAQYITKEAILNDSFKSFENLLSKRLLNDFNFHISKVIATIDFQYDEKGCFTKSATNVVPLSLYNNHDTN